MKKVLLSLFALCYFSAVMAQQKTRNLSRSEERRVGKEC